MFAAGGCFACHRFANEGGMTGPDLTGSGGRYSAHDLLDQIINPSREINEQFVPVIVKMKNGDTLTGVVVNMNGDRVTVNTDMFDPNQRVNVNRPDVASIEPSKVSPMPPGLLNLMREDEVMDLLAYIISGGNRDHNVYKKIIMKKFINLIPAICLTAWLGCDGGGTDSAENKGNGTDGNSKPAESKGVIAYSPLTLSNPFFKVIGDHIKAEAEKNGYEVRMVDPDMDVKKQSDQIDDFISSGVTAIVLVPATACPSAPPCSRRTRPAFRCSPWTPNARPKALRSRATGTDNFQGGELAGKAMINALGDTGGKVLILDFKKANSCVLRVGGFKKVIDAHNKTATGKVEVVSELDGNGDRTKGYQSTADALQAHEDLDAIFAINDPPPSAPTPP